MSVFHFIRSQRGILADAALCSRRGFWSGSSAKELKEKLSPFTKVPRLSQKNNQESVIQVTDAHPTVFRKLRDMFDAHLASPGLKRTNVQRAVALQIESFWDRHHLKLYGGVALIGSWIIWKSMRFTASAFVNVSESLAVTGVTTLGASATLFAAAWYYRRRFTISPNSVYRMAMLRLNAHPGVLEVMGAPVVGSDVRASVVTGGGIKLRSSKGWRPRIKSRRLQMMFPLKGPEKKGLVSLEAKKDKHGKLVLKLLALDIPSLSSPRDQAQPQYDRVYIEGGAKEYERGNILNDLRQPILSALGMDMRDDDDEDLDR
jgi:hypothetical protein